METDSPKPRPVFIGVLLLFTAVLLFIPFRIISYGFMPYDDALRHAAKAVSGKDWSEILVLRPGIAMDSHIGWHTILEFIYQNTGCSIDHLVIISIIFLFLLFAFMPIFFLKRPEAWLIALLIIIVANFFSLSRVFLGRPFIFSMAVVVYLGFAWTRFRSKPPAWSSMVILTVLIALTTWIHCLWYMLALPLACFFIAREWRAGAVIALCTFTGVGIGMLMTGHPIQFFSQTLNHFSHSLGGQALPWQLVPEFRPFNGDNMVAVMVLGLLCWRGIRNDWNKKAIDTPIFILAVFSWMLGFLVVRVWTDWGIPAICVWMALEVERYLTTVINDYSWKRVGLTCAVGCALFLSITSNYDDRWSTNIIGKCLSADNPRHQEWLPEKDGIIYSNSMHVFYRTFYANPHADWRYILGFEPSMMPPDDLVIFRKIQTTNDSPQALGLWVEKMRSMDRMILHTAFKPAVRELEWHLPIPGTWVGRLPRQKTPVPENH